MKASKTSRAWMREHVNDAFVIRAKAEGYRSRAAYKLMEIDDRDRLIRPGALVVDLGATPGGWSQVAAERLKGSGRVIAVDLLPLVPLPNVTFLQGDFRDDAVVAELLRLLDGRAPDLVIADMAPNISGIAISDQARAMYLCELALDFAARHLAPGGAFLVKTFQGAGFDDYYRALRTVFDKVATRKPKASRDRSPETYLLGLGRRPQAVPPGEPADGENGFASPNL